MYKKLIDSGHFIEVACLPKPYMTSQKIPLCPTRTRQLMELACHANHELFGSVSLNVRSGLRRIVIWYTRSRELCVLNIPPALNHISRFPINYIRNYELQSFRDLEHLVHPSWSREFPIAWLENTCMRKHAWSSVFKLNLSFSCLHPVCASPGLMLIAMRFAFCNVSQEIDGPTSCIAGTHLSHVARAWHHSYITQRNVQHTNIG